MSQNPVSPQDKSHLFARLAKQHSECATSKSGGDLGWMQRGTYFPSFEDTVQKTQVRLASVLFRLWRV